MKTGYCTSSVKKKCKICGRLTNEYKTFTQSEMEVVVPICQEHWNDIELQLAKIYFKADLFLREVNKTFKEK